MRQYGADRWGDFKVGPHLLGSGSLQMQMTPRLHSTGNVQAGTCIPLPCRRPMSCTRALQATLLGLLTACGAELSILQCANRVVAAGAMLVWGCFCVQLAVVA